MNKSYGTIRWESMLRKIEEINFNKILSNFKLPDQYKKKYSLPRIAFIGNFRTLSLTCQREIAKNLGFEYYPEIPFATYKQIEMQILTSKWSDITKDYTKLIVLGNPCIKKEYNGRIELTWQSEHHLFKTYKNDKEAIFLKYKIPIIFESELIKLHSQYPNINNNTEWGNEPNICVTGVKP